MVDLLEKREQERVADHKNLLTLLKAVTAASPPPSDLQRLERCVLGELRACALASRGWAPDCVPRPVPLGSPFQICSSLNIRFLPLSPPSAYSRDAPAAPPTPTPLSSTSTECLMQHPGVLCCTRCALCNDHGPLTLC